MSPSKGPARAAILLAGPVLVLALALALGCASKGSSSGAVLSLSSFTPVAGSFNLRVRLYQFRQGAGAMQSVETGVVPLEQAAIKKLVALGYTYQPDGLPDYLIEIHLACYDPKEAALDAAGATMAFDPAFEPFDGYVFPERVYVWSPQMDTIQNLPDTCASRMVMAVHDTRQVKPAVSYRGTRGGKADYAANCPFQSCAQGLEQAMLSELAKTFAE